MAVAPSTEKESSAMSSSVCPTHNVDGMEEETAKSSSACPPNNGQSLGEDWAKLLSPVCTEMENAVKYVWDDDTAEWKTRRVKLVMQEEPFKEGGMRVTHKAWEVTGDQMVAGIAKYLKKGATNAEMYFNEAMMQLLADDYALRFNEALIRVGSRRQIRFVPVTVLKLSERSGQIVSFEPFLGGKYVKHNDNNGHVDTKDELPQAFSHFTWEESQQNMLVCDIQGVGDLYTDPQIHSIDGEGFGLGNLGVGGIQKFFESHVCNGFCNAMGLQKVDASSVLSSSLSSEQKSQQKKGHHRRARSTSRSDCRVSLTARSTSPSDSDHSSSGDGSGHCPRRRGSLCSVGDSDDGQDSNLSQAKFAGELKKSGSLRRKSRKKVGKLWKSGKSFGKALVSAVKATVQSPTSSRRGSVFPEPSESETLYFPGRAPGSRPASPLKGQASPLRGLGLASPLRGLAGSTEAARKTRKTRGRKSSMA